MDVGLVAWIAFGKTGSTSLRYALWERARQKRWPTWPKPKCICHEELNEEEQPRRTALRCAALPSGYVVQTPRVGYCERLKQSRRASAKRPCKYFTLLREPTARVISAWNYYCRSCAERVCAADRTAIGNRAIHNARLRRDARGMLLERPLNTCPNMSLPDYAVLEGNRYMHALADQKGNDTTVLFEAARRTLRRRDVLVLFTERLNLGDLSLLSRALGDASNSSLKRLNMHTQPSKHMHGALLSLRRRDEALLGRILQHDVALYDEAVRLRGVDEPRASRVSGS